AVSGILFAIDRSDMRRGSIEIGSSDSKLLFVSIDPFPQLLTGSQSFPPCLGPFPHDIGRQPLTISAAEAPPLLLSVTLSFQTRRDGLPIVVAKCTRYTWHQAGIVERAQCVIKRDPEIRVHAANHIIIGRHPNPFSGFWILPREILVYELGDRFGDDLG